MSPGALPHMSNNVCVHQKALKIREKQTKRDVGCERNARKWKVF